MEAETKVLTPLEQARITVFEAELTALIALEESLKVINRTHLDPVREASLGQSFEGSLRESWEQLLYRVSCRKYSVKQDIEFLKGILPF